MLEPADDRDCVGYVASPPHAEWPGGARIALNINVNFEGGGERSSLNDELPYWRRVAGKPYLVIPYSFETNDNRFDENRGFSTAADFATYMIDAFDTLYAEGAERPKLMSLALHDRLTHVGHTSGQPYPLRPGVGA